MVEAYYNLNNQAQYIISDNNRIILITTNGAMARDLENMITIDHPKDDETLKPE